MYATTVPPGFKNAMQKVNEFGNSYSGVIAVLGAVATVLLLAKRMR